MSFRTRIHNCLVFVYTTSSATPPGAGMFCWSATPPGAGMFCWAASPTSAGRGAHPGEKGVGSRYFSPRRGDPPSGSHLNVTEILFYLFYFRSIYYKEL